MKYKSKLQTATTNAQKQIYKSKLNYYQLGGGKCGCGCQNLPSASAAAPACTCKGHRHGQCVCGCLFSQPIYCECLKKGHTHGYESIRETNT